MRTYNLIMLSMLICFQYPYSFVRRLAFKETLQNPVLYSVIITILMCAGLILHLIILWPILFIRQTWINDHDLFLDILEYKRLGQTEKIDKLMKKNKLNAKRLSREYIWFMEK